MPIRVLLVDDHRLLRQGVRTAVETEGDIVVCGEAESVEEAVGILDRTPVDIVLLDLHLKDSGDPTVALELVGRANGVKVIVLSMAGDDHSVMSAVRAGVRGYMAKTSSCGELVEALRTVARGGTYFGREIAEKLLERVRMGNLNTEPAPAAVKALAPRELQILRLVAHGQSSKEIAITLGLSEQTVRSYRKSLMKKLGLENAAGVTRFAIVNGLVDNPPPASAAAAS